MRGGFAIVSSFGLVIALTRCGSSEASATPAPGVTNSDAGADAATDSSWATDSPSDSPSATDSPSAIDAGDAESDSSASDDSGASGCDFDGNAPTVTVSTTQQLNDAIASASGPTVIWLDPGSYACLRIENALHTRAGPLILRRNPTATGDALIISDGCYYTTLVSGSSYVVLDGLTIEGGGAGVWVEASDHVILRGLTISGQGQEGIHVRKSSSFVDIVANHVFDTGHTEPKWAECLYVGTGSNDDFPDHTEHVWIENNELHECGNAEAINIKPEVFHATARGNAIHHITPGTVDQYNQSALTVEGSARSQGDYLPTEPRDVWLEDNTITDVTFGQWASGIMVGGTGVFVVGNTIQRYEERGIYVNGFGDLGLPVYLFGNQVDQTGQLDVYRASGVDVREADPGPNPNGPQDWYCH